MSRIYILSSIFFLGYSFYLTAMDNSQAAFADVVTGVMRERLKIAVPKAETSLELLSQELQGLFEKYIRLEKDKQKEVERDRLPESDAEAIFEPYNVPIEQLAGGISREIKGIIEVLKNPEHFKRQGMHDLPIGMLLQGPSGTGKTLHAKLIASLTGRVMAHEYSSSFITNFQGSGVDRIKRLFEQARKLNKPAIIFIDEIDGLANNELKGSEGEATRAVHELHRQLSIMGDLVFVIMATNNYDKIPASIKDRFANNTYFIDLPDFAARYALLKQLCARVPLHDQFFYKLATETGGLSCRVLENIVTSALISAGQRLPDCALAAGDFYIAAYTTQKMRLPTIARRLRLIKYYFEGKAVAPDVDDDCCALCVHETEGWDAQKIEKWTQLAQGLAQAKGCSAIRKEHLLIAFSLIDSDKVPNKIRRKLLFAHFLARRPVNNLANCMDILLEETENVTTDQLQTMIERAIEIMKLERKTQPTKKHLLTSCSLTFKKPLTHYKRLLLLNYYLTERQCSGVSPEFLHTLALQIQQTTVDDIKNIVGKAIDVRRSHFLLAPEREDFYVAVCLNQKNEPVHLREYVIALINYYLRQSIPHTLNQRQFDQLVDRLKSQTPMQIEAAIRCAENCARKRKAVEISALDVSLALYESCFKEAGGHYSLREIIIQFLLEGRSSASAVSIKKLIDGTLGLPFNRITRITETAREVARGSITGEDLYVGLFLELKNDEKDMRVIRAGYAIPDRVPFGDEQRLPDQFQRMALIRYYLNKKYHFVSDAFKTYLNENAVGASRYIIEQIVDLASVYASLSGITHQGAVHIREVHMVKAVGELCPHIGFWSWYLVSFGSVRDAYRRGFNVKA